MRLIHLFENSSEGPAHAAMQFLKAKTKGHFETLRYTDRKNSRYTETDILHCEIGEVHCMLEHEKSKKDMLLLRQIESHEPGSGAGTLALREIKALADKFGVSIRLCPAPFGAIFPREDDGGPTEEEEKQAKERLINWYQREGFKFMENRKEMIYTPNQPSTGQ